MKNLILMLLALGCVGARAELKLKGVRWTAADVVVVTVADGVSDPVEIEASLKDPARNPGRAGLITVAIQEYAVAAASANLKNSITLNTEAKPTDRNLTTIILRKQGVELASLYVLRQTPDQQYEYAHGRPMLDSATDLVDHVKEILRGLRSLNTCSDVASLEALTAYLKNRPDKQINDFHSDVEIGKIKVGEGASCAVITDPPKPVEATAKPGAAGTKPKAPQPARPPRARPPVPQYDAYGNPIPNQRPAVQDQRRRDPYADPYGSGGYGQPRGYDPRGGYDQGERGYGQGGGYGPGTGGYGPGGATGYGQPYGGYGQGY